MFADAADTKTITPIPIDKNAFAAEFNPCLDRVLLLIGQ